MRDRLYYGDIYKRVNGENHLVRANVLLVKSKIYDDYLIYSKVRKNPTLLLKDYNACRDLNKRLNGFIPTYIIRDGFYFIDKESLRPYQNKRKYTLIKRVMK